LPELPDAKRERLIRTYALPQYDARVLSGERAVADYFEAVVAAGADPKTAANWVMGEAMTGYNESGGFAVAPARLAELIEIVRDGTVSHQAAKKIYGEMLTADGSARAIAQRLGLVQVRDAVALEGWVDEVVAAHPGEVARFRAGEAKLMAFFVGQVMKRSQGKADPKAVPAVIARRLG
jgi:aspartyl-tRNA(Asn)/glutamyl-tRNA(Gln) amidotransferase subunit B